MSHVMYNFLTESFLYYENNLETSYSKYTDKQIEDELLKYREHILKHFNDIVNEIEDGHNNTTAFSQIYDSKTMEIDILKQCGLYMHKFILDDPIFKFASNIKENTNSTALNTYLGLSSTKNIDRKNLVEIIKYLKNITPGVVADYIKFIPGSLIYESPKQLPFYYSKDNFNSLVNPNIAKYFEENSTIVPIEKRDNKLILDPQKTLTPCRNIHITLKDHNSISGYGYLLFESKIKYANLKTGKLQMMQYLPDTPPSEEKFNVWVNNSINRTAINFCSKLEQEIYISSKLSSMYFTTSKFINNLLDLNFKESDTSIALIRKNVSNSLLNISLPIIDNISFERLMEIRNSEGESFENFRIKLESKLNELRYLKDEDSLKAKINDIVHELTEVDIINMDKKIKSLVKKSLIDSMMIVSGVLVPKFFATGKLSFFDTLVPAAQGVRTYIDLRKQERKNPAYFMWKVNKNLPFELQVKNK